jgi:hypothetical protein
MKFIAKFVLTVIFIPVFLIFLLAVNLRFQLLTPSYWEGIFSLSGTYSELSSAVNKNLVFQTVAQGGSASDVKILTDLLSPENLKDVINTNIINVLQYANGKAKEITVYLPVEKIPATLISGSFTNISERMSLTDFLKEFNISGISASQIQSVSRLGLGSWIFLVSTVLLMFLLLYLLYLLVKGGKRLIAPGLALVISGTTAFLIRGVIVVIEADWVKALTISANTGNLFIGIIVPPVIQGVLKIWLSFAAGAIVLGVILFFIKKPLYNSKSK